MSVGEQNDHRMNSNAILGIWDGHDAGAALLIDNKIVSAVNEERLSRRKLDVGFPSRSIATVLREGGVEPGDVCRVAASTSDFSKTLTRVIPRLKEEYYLLRRRKKFPGALNALKKRAKYRLTEIGSNALTRTLSRRALLRDLERCGIRNAELHLLDHHTCHAATAAFASPFSQGLVLTLDGIGDGASGGIWRYREDRLEPLERFSGSDSLGIFFEHVTNILNYRELEDEGKVMALANYSLPVPDSENECLGWFVVDGTKLRARISTHEMRRRLLRMNWSMPREQFAYIAQRVLEVRIVELAHNALRTFGESTLLYAGGVASNVKVNLLLREKSGAKEFFVFPHMGDGGLAVGAALLFNQQQNGASHVPLESLQLSCRFDGPAVLDAAKGHSELFFDGRELSQKSIAELAAQEIASGEVIMWCQGGMEYGPRALGGRSILALPGSLEIKDALNLRMKRRVWYQPFCPSMLENDACELLVDYDGRREPYMTSAYRVRPERRLALQGVISVDGTCRPQILREDDQSIYADLLRQLRLRTGLGVVLNTSFNLHGEPLICSPDDALRTFTQTDIPSLYVGDFCVKKSSHCP